MNRLLFCEPWLVSNSKNLLDQFLDGIISLFVAPKLKRSFLLALGRLRRCITALGGACDLFLLRTRADGRLRVVGQDLGNAQYRDFVAVTALAARILAAALLEGDDLRSALVVQ